MKNESKMLDAFINQTYGSIEKAMEADKIADVNPHSIGNEHMEFEQNTKFRQELASRMKQVPISETINIPTKIKTGDLDSKTQVHDNFKKYDHSLEEKRSQKLGLIKIKENNIGDVEEMFDNIFNDNSNLVE